jgi:general secretion pathway protein G
VPHLLARPPRPPRRGFTLIEVIVAVAIVAVLAGAITPMVFRELMQAREEATLRELAALESGLVAFYEDTGRLPTADEGLAALAADPGVGRWQGPYVASDRGDPVQEVTTDAFGTAYVYDPEPTTDPADAAAAVLVSAGSDGTVTCGRPGATWTLAPDGDDLIRPVALAPVARGQHRDCEAELAALAGAASAYWADHAAFPARLTDLSGQYLDAGVEDAALRDPWHQPYALTVLGGGTAAPRLQIRSLGPDRTDQAGAGDDLAVEVSSIPPGRRTTLWKLEIAQTALNNNPTLALTGNWAADRAALGLAPAFQTDGWGRPFAVQVTSRAVYSAGPDGNAALAGDNLPAGVGP